MIPAILSALTAFFGLVGKVFDWLYARQMVDAGKVENQLAVLQKQVEDARKAVAAREAIRASLSSGGVPERDPFQRD